MKRNNLAVLAAALALGCAAALACAATDDAGQTSGQSSGMTGQTTQKDAQAVISHWPAKSQAAAQELIQKYGQPETVTNGMLAWADKGEWKRVAVYKKAARANVFPSNANMIENTVSYNVPTGKVLDLKKLDHNFIIDTKNGTLSHRGDSEGENILALNLADELLTGKRDVASAKDFRNKTMKESLAGKSSPYMQKLMFTPGRSQQNTPSSGY